MDSALPVTWLTVKPTIQTAAPVLKQEQDKLVKNSVDNKRTKNDIIFNFYLVFDFVLIANKNHSVR